MPCASPGPSDIIHQETNFNVNTLICAKYCCNYPSLLITPQSIKAGVVCPVLKVSLALFVILILAPTKISWPEGPGKYQSEHAREKFLPSIVLHPSCLFSLEFYSPIMQLMTGFVHPHLISPCKLPCIAEKSPSMVVDTR